LTTNRSLVDVADVVRTSQSIHLDAEVEPSHVVYAVTNVLKSALLAKLTVSWLPP